VLFIDFYTGGNGGWFTVPPDSASSSIYNEYINNNSLKMPPLNIGDIINLSNGENSTVLQNIDSHLVNNSNWDTFLPVVDTNSFNQSQPIVGFVPFRVTASQSTGSNKGVTGTVLGAEVSATAEPGETNGYFAGTLAPVKLMN
jgi:hypothetical protein